IVMRLQPSPPLFPYTTLFRSQIATRMRLDAARKAAEERGQQIIARLQAGETWEALQADGIESVGARLVTRQDGIAPPAVLREAFAVDQSSMGNGKVQVGGGRTDHGNLAVLAVRAVINGGPAQVVP